MITGSRAACSVSQMDMFHMRSVQDPKRSRDDIISNIKTDENSLSTGTC